MAEIWVQDGFNLNERGCQRLADSLNSYAYSNEIKVRVLTAPDPKEIRKTQGYIDDKSS